MNNMNEPYKQRDHLEYPKLTMYQMVERAALQYPDPIIILGTTSVVGEVKPGVIGQNVLMANPIH